MKKSNVRTKDDILYPPVFTPALKPEPTFSWDELDRLVKPQGPPPNSFTKEEFMARYGLGRARADQRLTALVADGTLQFWKGLKGRNFYYYSKLPLTLEEIQVINDMAPIEFGSKALAGMI
jgi:hypothetical protein